MVWTVIILSITVAILSIITVLYFMLYKLSMREKHAVYSMFIMAVFDHEFCQRPHVMIMDYLQSITANNALEVSAQFMRALTNMAVTLAESTEGSILLGAHAAIWQAFKEAKEKTQ